MTITKRLAAILLMLATLLPGLALAGPAGATTAPTASPVEVVTQRGASATVDLAANSTCPDTCTFMLSTASVRTAPQGTTITQSGPGGSLVTVAIASDWTMGSGFPSNAHFEAFRIGWSIADTAGDTAKSIVQVDVWTPAVTTPGSPSAPSGPSFGAGDGSLTLLHGTKHVSLANLLTVHSSGCTPSFALTSRAKRHGVTLRLSPAGRATFRIGSHAVRGVRFLRAWAIRIACTPTDAGLRPMVSTVHLKAFLPVAGRAQTARRSNPGTRSAYLGSAQQVSRHRD